ncbi:MAG: nitrate- and nitrite sensing domain-containing protein [Pseudomonadota bacterium]
MKWLKSLTVTQSLVTLFVSGFAVAFIFASIIVVQDVKRYRDIRHDDRILHLAKAVETVVHEMQIERGLTSAWIAGNANFADRIAEQRLETDAVVTAMQTATKGLDNVTDPSDPLRSWLQAHRAAVDSGRLDYRTHLDEMTRKNREMIGLIAENAIRARSASLARKLREDTVLFLAKDSLGLERAMGATILAMIEEGRAVDLEMMRRLTALSGEREFAFSTHRLLSGEDRRRALELLERMPPANLLSEWRTAIERRVLRDATIPADNAPLPASERWFDTATTLVESLREIEAEGENALRAELIAEAAAIRADAQHKVLILLGLTAFFGACAIVTLRSVRASLKGLIGSICRLSVSPREAEIPVCRQADLNQIADALRVLRDIQVEQQTSHETAESLRQRFDDNVHDMLRSVADGETKQRIELLDLDGPNAVLARGINHLLDQLELKGKSAA